MARSAAASSGRSDRTHRAVAVPVSGTALLLIDVINDLAFEVSATLVEQAEPMPSRLAPLKRRVSAAGVPTIYIKDDFGQCDPTSVRRSRTARHDLCLAVGCRNACGLTSRDDFVQKTTTPCARFRPC
jgi:nicotinamidase-related amidase